MELSNQKKKRKKKDRAGTRKKLTPARLERARFGCQLIDYYRRPSHDSANRGAHYVNICLTDLCMPTQLMYEVRRHGVLLLPESTGTITFPNRSTPRPPTNGRMNLLGMRHVGASLGATLNTMTLAPLLLYSSSNSSPFTPYTLQHSSINHSRDNNMGHSSSKSSSRHSLSRSVTTASSPVPNPEMDRKVFIPLCFCLISFAVMVYVN